MRDWREPCYATPERYLRDCRQSTPDALAFTAATIYCATALAEVGGFRPELGHLCDTFALQAVALRHGACYAPQLCATYRIMPAAFGVSGGRNLADSLALSERVAALMRSQEFGDRFPAVYVRAWQRNFERWVLDCHVYNLRQRYGSSGAGRWIGRALKQFMNLKLALAYHGDAGAYLRRRVR